MLAVVSHLFNKMHLKKRQPFINQAKDLFLQFKADKLDGQKTLLGFMKIADKLNFTQKWELKSRTVESNVFKKAYMNSINMDTSQDAKNQDQKGLYTLRKNNQPFIIITKNYGWYPIKKRWHIVLAYRILINMLRAKK